MKKLTVSFSSDGVVLENMKYSVYQDKQLLAEGAITGKISL